ncbi:MAG: nucleotidyltransferase domain-containing protein [Colwellia sp.]|nr:nucleotidyltransferase domain-containing protein [Colwellia sp.]
MQSKLDKAGLSDQTVSKIKAVFKHNQGVEQVYLYGSRATGKFKNGSDIDLTIKNSTVSFDDLLKLELQLDDLMTPYMFDLSIFENIENPKLKEHIEKYGVEFYTKRT